MSVTSIKMTIREKGASKAVGSICLDDKLIIRGMQVVQRPDGTNFVSWPSNKTKDGKFIGVVFSPDDDFRTSIDNAFLAEYESLITK